MSVWQPYTQPQVSPGARMPPNTWLSWHEPNGFSVQSASTRHSPSGEASAGQLVGVSGDRHSRGSGRWTRPSSHFTKPEGVGGSTKACMSSVTVPSQTAGGTGPVVEVGASVVAAVVTVWPPVSVPVPGSVEVPVVGPVVPVPVVAGSVVAPVSDSEEDSVSVSFLPGPQATSRPSAAKREARTGSKEVRISVMAGKVTQERGAGQAARLPAAASVRTVVG
ncbi:hypothetical protein [Nannocystis pusilla]|uniref:hypothetical protein n=1 Tax=Nannocystis pusilla TaxID=889268 RepID=UPI003B81D29D